MISRVIAACRTLFMYSVRLSIISPELRVAASIAVICAAKIAACRLEQRPEHLHLDVARDQVREQLLRRRLVQIVHTTPSGGAASRRLRLAAERTAESAAGARPRRAADITDLNSL